jgi:hypothetical protein
MRAKAKVMTLMSARSRNPHEGCVDTVDQLPRLIGI